MNEGEILELTDKTMFLTRWLRIKTIHSHVMITGIEGFIIQQI